MEDRVVFITTEDNPYDYFDDFDHWYDYDTMKGYNTCSLVARMSSTSLEQSSADYRSEIERVVDELVDWHFLPYKKIEKVAKVI